MMHDPERQSLPSASEMCANSKCVGRRALIHSLREKGLLLKGSSADARLGERIHASLVGEEEDLERKAHEIRDDCDRLATLAATQYFGHPPGELQRILYEQRFWYHIGETPFFSGKPDRVYVNSERILDVNFKTGRGDEEDAHLNLQLRTEVVLLKHCYPEVKEIAATIVQPLVTHTPEIAVYSEDELHQALVEILEIVDQTAWEVERTAGPWCKFCPARAFCPEARALATIDPLKVSVEALPSGAAASEMLEKVNVAYDILDALWEAFKAKVATEPEAVPGWRIGPGKKVRYVKDLWLASAIAREDLTHLSTLPIGKLEDWVIRHDRKLNEFNEAIGIKQTAGSLEKIPKRLRTSV
jgi:hypothetical protein